MDKSQAEAAANALLAQARANRKPTRRPATGLPQSSSARWLLLVIAGLGVLVASLASWALGSTVGWGAAAAIWVSVGGPILVVLVITAWRSMAARARRP